jgi:hypothetical protein
MFAVLALRERGSEKRGDVKQNVLLGFVRVTLGNGGLEDVT